MATEGRGGGGSLSNSLTDLMTSLIVIFVLLLVATLDDASEEGANTHSLILDQLAQELKDFEKQALSVKQDPQRPFRTSSAIPRKPSNSMKMNPRFP